MPFADGVRKAGWGAAALLVAAASPAEAQQRRIDIPGGSLGQAAIALGRQTGTSIGITDPRLASLRVRPVRGHMPIRHALARMLKGTDASFAEAGPGGWRIVARPRPRAVAAPPPPRIIAVPPEAEPEPEEVVVTASKRGTPLGNYPGAVAVLAGGTLPPGSDARGTEALSDVLPALGSTHLGPGRNKLFVRGVADSSFNGPTQATVGQYLGETRLNYNAPDPDLRLYDIASVELLEGPQGTLHGAGSLGGILRALPAPPYLREVGGSASAQLSAIQHGGIGYDLHAVANAPLIEDRLGLRLLGYAGSEAGYIDDRLRALKDVNRTDIQGGRAMLRAEAPSGWTIDVALTGQRIEGRDAQYADQDTPPLTRESHIAEAFDNDYLLGSVTVTRRWDALSFVSSTGFIRQSMNETYDATQVHDVPSAFNQRNEITMFSIENRLAREETDGFGWILGTSFISNQSDIRREFGPVGRPVRLTGVENGIEEGTLFGEASLKLIGPLRLSAGGRLTYSRLSGQAVDSPVFYIARNGAVSAARSETTFLPSAALSFRPREDSIFYLRYQESFRPGGLGLNGNFVQRYRNDEVSTLEAGMRHGLPGDAVELAAAVAYTDWRNIQADLVDSVGLPTTANIGDGRIYTAEASLTWRPIEGLAIDVAGIFNDSKVTNPVPDFTILPAEPLATFNVDPPTLVRIADSSPLPNVARFSGRAGIGYAATLADGTGIEINASARYVGRSRLGVGDVLGEPQGDYLDTQAGARVTLGRIALFGGITNLLDTKGNRFALGSPFTMIVERQLTPLRPRTVRIGIETYF